MNRYRDDTYRTWAELLAACDHCAAAAGEPCVSRSGRLTRPHQRRRADPQRSRPFADHERANPQQPEL